MTDKKNVPGWVHFAAGASGGTIGILITCPLEVVKTRMQSSKSAQFMSRLPTSSFFARSKTLMVLQDTFLKEGMRGLWRGLGPNLFGVVPSRSIYFSTYNFAKKTITQYTGRKETPLVHLTSAFCAGLTTTSVTNPVWLVKTRLQLSRASPDSRAHSAIECIKDVLRTEGVRGFYRGLMASYIGEACMLFPRMLSVISL
jgi:solute carrier family 25 protein 33/36